MPKTWARGGLFESVYHFAVMLNAAVGAPASRAVVERAASASRPEVIALRFEHGGATSELVIEGDASTDELTLFAGDLAWSRIEDRITWSERGEVAEVEREGSDIERMLDAFARLVADGTPMLAKLEDAADAIETTHLALAAVEAAGIPLARATEPRHAATKGLRRSYS
jgi:hypothetical protein